jgi:hypothetical protein
MSSAIPMPDGCGEHHRLHEHRGNDELLVGEACVAEVAIAPNTKTNRMSCMMGCTIEKTMRRGVARS